MNNLWIILNLGQRYPHKVQSAHIPGWSAKWHVEYDQAADEKMGAQISQRPANDST